MLRNILLILFLSFSLNLPAEELSWVQLSEDQTQFIDAENQKPFRPVGFNYDHDEFGTLLEDYWADNWIRVEEDFQEMKQLGANVVRIHLQVSRFMKSPQELNQQALDRFSDLIQLAEKTGLYLDVTGLGCYHKQDVPAWYDTLSREERWEVQCRFWEAIAQRGAGSPAIFCYDLMNEPVVAGGKKARTDWLAGEFAGKHFVQFINLALPADTTREQLAMTWIRKLKQAIRKHDRRHLITVGLIGNPRNKQGKYFHGFPVQEVAIELDFIAVHIYPETGKQEKSFETLSHYQFKKPVVIEEIFPLRCSTPDLESFITQAEKRKLASGWIGFYWGKKPEEYQGSEKLTDQLTLQWLELFQKTIAPKSD